MQQSQHSINYQQPGFLPGVAYDAGQNKAAKIQPQQFDNLRPITLKEASAFLGMPQEEVEVFAREGLIPHVYCHSLKIFLFNKTGLIRFCEKIADWGNSAANDNPVAGHSSFPPVHIEPEVSNDSHELETTSIDHSNQAAAISTLETHPKLDVEPVIERSTADAVQPADYSSSHETLLKRLSHICSLTKTQLTSTLDMWDISKTTPSFIDESLMNELGINVPYVDKADPSEGFRIDFRSAHSLVPTLKRHGIPMRMRLVNKDRTSAIAEATRVLDDVQARTGVTVGLDKKILERNQTIFRAVLKKAERLVRDQKSSEEQVDERKRKLAFWNYVFAYTDLCVLDQELLEQIIDVLHFSKKQPSTINKHLIELRAIYEYAFGKRWINEPIDINSYQSGSRELIELPEHQFQSFVTQYAENDAEKNLLTLAFHTGIRKGNAVNGIMVDNIHLKDGPEDSIKNASLISLRANAVKGRKRIDIHIPTPAKNAIKAQLAWRQSQGISHQNLFARDNYGTPIQIDMKRWIPALAKAGIDTNFRFHHFRHNRAHCLLQEGSGFESVRQLLGLASIKMVQYVYGHINVTQEAIKVSESASHA
ncbi:MAG: tyrosine-type recombinase/integrase [Gammaproteobacteria bacterium]|nr:tyrosine-type recombinase/integrase [Pseudoalteromonas sp.]MCP4273362.1 tyrosine-type recombinase/integrase [Gammaproteobacteria bacterium]